MYKWESYDFFCETVLPEGLRNEVKIGKPVVVDYYLQLHMFNCAK